MISMSALLNEIQQQVNIQSVNDSVYIYYINIIAQYCSFNQDCQVLLTQIINDCCLLIHRHLTMIVRHIKLLNQIDSLSHDHCKNQDNLVLTIRLNHIDLKKFQKLLIFFNMNQILKLLRNDLFLNNLTKVLIQIQIQTFKQMIFMTLHQYISHQNMLNEQFIYSVYLSYDSISLIINHSHIILIKHQISKMFLLNEFLQICLKFF